MSKTIEFIAASDVFDTVWSQFTSSQSWNGISATFIKLCRHGIVDVTYTSGLAVDGSLSILPGSSNIDIAVFGRLCDDLPANRLQLFNELQLDSYGENLNGICITYTSHEHNRVFVRRSTDPLDTVITEILQLNSRVQLIDRSDDTPFANVKQMVSDTTSERRTE